MFWWLKPVAPCCDPSLKESLKLPITFGNEELSSLKYIFGRKSDCSLRLKDQSISGHHCVVQVGDSVECLVLTDTSTNGTFVNGKRIAKSSPVTVKSGDTISLTRPKVIDDNVVFHAVFKLVYSQISPDETEKESVSNICEQPAESQEYSQNSNDNYLRESKEQHIIGSIVQNNVNLSDSVTHAEDQSNFMSRDNISNYTGEIEKLSGRYSINVDNIAQLFDNQVSQDVFASNSRVVTGNSNSNFVNGDYEEMKIRDESTSLTLNYHRQSVEKLVEKIETLEAVIESKENTERNLRYELASRLEEVNCLNETIGKREYEEQQLRQYNKNLMQKMHQIQQRCIDVEHELEELSEKHRVVCLTVETMEQNFAKLNEELSLTKQELSVTREKLNQQNIALKSMASLTQKKCLSILHSLKDLHQITNTFGLVPLSSSNRVFDHTFFISTPWRNSKRPIEKQFYLSGAQTERPHKMKASPMTSVRSNCDFSYYQTSNSRGKVNQDYRDSCSFPRTNKSVQDSNIDIVNGIGFDEVEKSVNLISSSGSIDKFISSVSTLEDQLLSKSSWGFDYNDNNNENLPFVNNQTSNKTISSNEDSLTASNSNKDIKSISELVPTNLA
ncbi:FHA domain-containing protein [Cryptosporidium muris RN66]|uniref:FHA domain-containing protein n=1 Tax=Cryptosporidium muris (strain RN66) TaxID=441375 RepID=B6A9L7_CRYMR|nr:FHA domain-containing protein [Cryptosporidium muris RN66]EEA04908.1 FHA domain-containing protein [Cryptosporidium muris RN66]|eukprot:XP_002139257.1 FHA domain-containing protein [Cryptosporidium muris RN66]